MKFINKYTGVILETSNEFVIDQYKKSDRYEIVEEKKVEVKEIKPEPKKKTTKK